MRPDPGADPEPAAPMRAALCYVMCPSAEEALAIARRLVDERLAACGNVLPGALSVYRWQGAVQEAGEVALVLKTRAELAPALVARVAELHSYDCPGITVLPIVDGAPAYLEWITQETSLQ